MSKILLTGMSAPHASTDANKRSLSFASLLSHVLTVQGHEITQTDPEISWEASDLNEYDHVLVGLSPLTSLSANRVYGALNVIDVLRESDKLALYIDAPEPVRITASLRAMTKNPQNMTKPFYSYRKGYMHASTPSVLDDLMGVVDYLLNETWPTTLYPSLPWSGTGKVISQLPTGAAASIKGINLDSYLLTLQDPIEIERREKWVVENFSTNWTKSTLATLSSPTVPMKWHKGWTDEQVSAQIASGIGALISPYQTGGTWWTYRLVQCINALTPVATDWRESGALGEPWLHIAAGIEEMSADERSKLAKEQRDTYIQAIPNKRDAAVMLSDSLEIFSRKA